MKPRAAPAPDPTSPASEDSHLPRRRLRATPTPSDRLDAGAARLVILRALSRRELSEAQARTRLADRGFPPETIDEAIGRLKDDRALDDTRVARACARVQLELRRRGPARAVRQIEQLGIARETARQAVADVTATLDPADLLERALARRLSPGQTIPDRATFARLYRFLVGQGFPSHQVMEALNGRRERRTRDQD